MFARPSGILLVLLIAPFLTATPSRAECNRYRESFRERFDALVTPRDLQGRRQVRPLPAGGLDTIESRHFDIQILRMIAARVVAQCPGDPVQGDARQAVELLEQPDSCLEEALTPAPGEKLVVRTVRERYSSCLEPRR